MDSPAGSNSIVPTLADFILINEEIAAVVKARLPLETYLACMGGDLPGKSGELATRIGRRMEGGESLAAAIDAECRALPSAYRAAIIAGIESGDLGAAIESLVDAASRLDQLRRVTGLALLYPLMVIVVACLLFGLVLAVVIPQFDWLTTTYFGPLTALAHSTWAAKSIAFALPAVVVVFFMIWWWRSSRVASALASLPGIHRVDRLSQAATFAEMLRLLVERGLPLDRALLISADAVTDSKMRSAATQLAARARHGEIIVPSSGELQEAERSGIPLLVRLALKPCRGSPIDERRPRRSRHPVPRARNSRCRMVFGVRADLAHAGDRRRRDAGVHVNDHLAVRFAAARFGQVELGMKCRSRMRIN
jgi:general secretion pathway protein F